MDRDYQYAHRYDLTAEQKVNLINNDYFHEEIDDANSDDDYIDIPAFVMHQFSRDTILFHVMVIAELCPDFETSWDEKITDIKKAANANEAIFIVFTKKAFRYKDAPSLQQEKYKIFTLREKQNESCNELINKWIMLLITGYIRFNFDDASLFRDLFAKIELCLGVKLREFITEGSCWLAPTHQRGYDSCLTLHDDWTDSRLISMAFDYCQQFSKPADIKLSSLHPWEDNMDMHKFSDGGVQYDDEEFDQEELDID